jgi:hypothetical protein
VIGETDGVYVSQDNDFSKSLMDKENESIDSHGM